MMKIFILIGAAIGGVIVGQFTGAFLGHGGAKVTEDDRKRSKQQVVEAVERRAVYSEHPHHRLSDPSHEPYREVESFKTLTSQLNTEGRSPIRNQSLLRSRLYCLSSEEVQDLLKKGEIQTTAEIKRAAEYLMEIDPDAMYRFFSEGGVRFETMPKRIAFFKSMHDIEANRDPLRMLEALKSLKRGGNQMANSLWFSSSWIRVDPEAAVAHFDEILLLRNKMMSGQEERRLVGLVARSWKGKDVESLSEFIAEMPDGRRKEFFIEEFTK